MVLQSIYQLHNTLSDRKILSWDFFLNRFEALFLEAQINSNKTLDFANLRGKKSSLVKLYVVLLGPKFC